MRIIAMFYRSGGVMKKNDMKKAICILVVILLTVCMGLAVVSVNAKAKSSKPAKVKGLQCKNSIYDSYISIRWKRAKKAKKYQVYVKDFSWKKVATIKKHNYKYDTSFVLNKTIKVKVRAVNGKKKGKYSAVKTVKVIIPVRMISVNKYIYNLKVGQKEKVYVNFYPYNATNQKYSVRSTISRVAVVDKQGYIVAKDGGRTTLTFSSDNGKTATCIVKVEVPVTNVRLSRYYLSLKKGETQYLNAYVDPYNASDKKIQWKSSNSSIAYVNTYGGVTAASSGEAIITAVSSNGIKAECKVHVHE